MVAFCALFPPGTKMEDLGSTKRSSGAQGVPCTLSLLPKSRECWRKQGIALQDERERAEAGDMAMVFLSLCLSVSVYLCLFLCLRPFLSLSLFPSLSPSLPPLCVCLSVYLSAHLVSVRQATCELLTHLPS